MENVTITQDELNKLMSETKAQKQKQKYPHFDAKKLLKKAGSAANELKENSVTIAQEEVDRLLKKSN